MNHAKRSRRVLFCAHDPGGANQMVAVYDLLQSTLCETGNRDPENSRIVRNLRSELHLGNASLDFIACGHGPALSVWQRAGIEAIEWEPSGEPSLIAYLETMRIDSIVSEAPSRRDLGYQDLWRAARASGIRSVVFLDHDVNVTDRFRDAGGGLVLPNCVYLLSERARDEIREAGANDVSLHVNPNLHLARTVRLSEDAPADAKTAALREHWQAAPSDTVVLFASECVSEMVAQGYPKQMEEHAVVDDLLSRIAAGTALGKTTIGPDSTVLIIRPHPRDTPGKYNRFLNDTRCRVRISAQGDPTDAIRAADLIVGVTSMMLQEAKVLGKPVTHLEPFGSR
jgi:hypothetical protein